MGSAGGTGTVRRISSVTVCEWVCAPAGPAGDSFIGEPSEEAGRGQWRVQCIRMSGAGDTWGGAGRSDGRWQATSV